MYPTVSIDETDVRDLCTDAVFERGMNYREEGRIRRLDRVGSSITATVQGSRRYELDLDLDAEGFDPSCTCPYDGPGECKHVVAVLLELKEGLPGDDAARIDPLVEDATPTDLREFLREALTQDPDLRERFLARFGESSGKSVEEYREGVETLFEEHTEEYPVVIEAIDFSRFTDLAEEHRERGNYAEAATIYRALAVGIEENFARVDAAYDHYAGTFTAALDGYVECVAAADRDEERSRAVEFLSRRATSGVDYLREHYERALDDLDVDETGK